MKLPSTHITPVYRSDGSGTSFVFTDYLSSVSPEWASKVGTSTQPTFPTGTGAEHSSGVIADMQATNGAITYAETSYIAADMPRQRGDPKRGRETTLEPTSGQAWRQQRRSGRLGRTVRSSWWIRRRRRQPPIRWLPTPTSSCPPSVLRGSQLPGAFITYAITRPARPSEPRRGTRRCRHRS